MRSQEQLDEGKGSSAAPSLPAVLSSSDSDILELYGALLAFCNGLGPFVVEEKKTSIHLVRDSAFAGLHPRRKHLVLTLKASAEIKSDRVFRSEQVSRHRWHHEIKLNARKDLDQELLGWLREAYALSG